MDDADDPKQSTADMTAFVSSGSSFLEKDSLPLRVQNLLQQMQSRFQTMSDSIITKNILIVLLVNFKLNQSDFEEMNPLMDNFDLFVSSTVSTDNVKSELDHYLDEAVLPRTSYFDILGWWKSNGTKYPILSALARDILAIPISTFASESAFSTSGRFVSPHRSRLHSMTLEALMCAQNWIWKEIQVAALILKIWIWMRNHAPLMGVKEEHHEI